MKTFIKNFIADESGASAAEYALIIAIVGVGVGAAALALGANVEAAIGNAANEVDKCNNAAGPAPGQYTVAGANKC
ncbi:Flp family type IVb pilin [Tsuneonella sp. YG55]|uniref:Flp family type IVb pilin n=1 Tax=Tsuneonella litorea TaxID=2976475 RepID=A0A9X2W2I5_9SPHN|nr:Flp family type IVb pilin [Tsuneonella litorea]MCT2559378.1 Flp family type IVb pilin [Tsuneonella litorea]